MTRQDLIDAIAERTDLKKVQADAALRAFEEAVTGALKKGDAVSLVGFGSFQARKRKARKGLNPQTKKPVTIPARTVPAFRAGKKLRDAVGKKK